MNIFYLDECPTKAAEYHHDKHVVKMVLESAQLLSTCHRYFDGMYADVNGLYKSTHANHPCSVWLRQSKTHYSWLFLHYRALCNEYKSRYSREHKSSSLYYGLSKYPYGMFDVPFVPPPQCMPDKYKVEGDTVQAYRNYYKGEKLDMSDWFFPATRPEWVDT